MLKKLLTIFGVMLLFMGVGLLIAGAVKVFASSEQFKATARVKVVPLTASNMGRPMFGRQPYPNVDSNLMRREMERIQSTLVLFQVITNLDLNKRWAEKQGQKEELKTEMTFILLKHQLDLRPGRDAASIDISAFGDDKAEVADLANNVASVFRDTRFTPTASADIDSSASHRVEIIELAQAPQVPVHTKRPEGLRLVALGILPTLFGLLLTVAGLLLKKPMPVPPKLSAPPSR
jgi:capsular polysaccharide biosynthesis protein